MEKSPGEVIAGLVADQDLAFQFFAVFSRFEYALKRSGFFLKGQERAEVNWDEYANTIRGCFAGVAAPAFQDACAYLKREPPKTQVVTDGNLGWKDTVQGDGEIQERFVLRLVQTVRNNLFHGGKYPYPFGPVADAARNARLIRSSIAVLEECLNLSPAVGQAFEEAA